MKRKIINMYILLFLAFGYASAQDIITVTANDYEISDNLDLEAVASIFGDSEDLEDFENRLNDPYTQISNLDLNRDGYVDYLRVVELSENKTHLIAIQAVIGDDLYQDVATIEVEQDRQGVTTVQVVGNVYMYGPNYIIEPVYVHRPLIILWFWGAFYRPWHSPYYWAYYPNFYRPWRPYHPHIYWQNVHVHINVHHVYHHTTVRNSMTAINMHHKVHRNDYGNRHPEKSFAKRNKGISNRGQLIQQREAVVANNKQSRPSKNVYKKVQKDWKDTPERDNREKASRKHTPTTQKKAVQQRSNRTVKKPATTVRHQSSNKKQYSKKPARRYTERAKQDRNITAKTARTKSTVPGKQGQKTSKGKIKPGRN